MSNYRTLYLRDDRGFPVACVSMKLDRHSSKVSYGMSVLNPKDNFDRGVARHLSLGRLVDMPNVVSVPQNSNTHEVSFAIVRDIISHSKNGTVPTRAAKAAKLWLKAAKQKKNKSS